MENIGGCLIVFACRESFKGGHDGAVYWVPKSQLINHYPSLIENEKKHIKQKLEFSI